MSCAAADVQSEDGSGAGPDPPTGDPFAATAVPVALNEHDCVDVETTFSSGVSSISVHPAGAVTGTPPMCAARAGRSFVPAGVTPSERWMLPTAAKATAITTTPARTPPTAVRA